MISDKVKFWISNIVQALLILVGLWAFIIIFIAMFGCEGNKEEKSEEISFVSTEALEKVSGHNLIHFDFDNVEDFIWSNEDGCFTIEYNDPDIFDYQHLAEITGRDKWYGHFVALDIENSDVSQFIQDWEDYLDNRNSFCETDDSTYAIVAEDINDSYAIVEYWIPEVSDYLWFLVKLPSNVYWWQL